MEELSAKRSAGPDEDRDGWLGGHRLLLADGSSVLSLTLTGQSIGCGALVINRTQVAAFFSSPGSWAEHCQPSCLCHCMEMDERSGKHVADGRAASV